MKNKTIYLILLSIANMAMLGINASLYSGKGWGNGFGITWFLAMFAFPLFCMLFFEKNKEERAEIFMWIAFSLFLFQLVMLIIVACWAY